MDNEFNKDLTPEAEAEIAETAEETVASEENELSSKIEKRFSKYPDPASLALFANTKPKKAALAAYSAVYASYAETDSFKEKRRIIMRLNTLLHAQNLSPVIVASEAVNSNEKAAECIENGKRLAKKGKIVSAVFLAVFLLIAAVFTAIKVLPNINSFADVAANGFFFVCLLVYIVLSVYASVEIKNLFASMGSVKAHKLLPEIESIPAKLEGAELAELSEPCTRCAENPRIDGSDYCEACHEETLSTKVPFIGWIAGAGILVASVAALVILFFTAAPAFYTLNADLAAEENRWDDAVEGYMQVQQTANEFSTYLSPDSPVAALLQVGENIKIKLVVAYANAYSPVQAVQAANSLFADTEKIKNDPRLKEYFDIYDRYSVTYEACMKHVGEEEDYDLCVEGFTKALEEKGVDKAVIYHTLFGLAANNNKDISVQLDFLSKADAYAKEMGYDYDWLYGYDYAAALRKAGKFEEALRFYDALIENNKNDLYSATGKVKCLISLGKAAEAEAFVDAIEKDGEINEFTLAMDAVILRSKGEYDAVIALCETAFETYDTSAELHHQLALTYMLKGDYESAYEHANIADYNGLYWAQYTGSKAYSYEYLNSLFLSANLCSKAGGEQAQAAQSTITELNGYGEEQPETVTKIVNGEIALEDVLMKGAYDIL